MVTAADDRIVARLRASGCVFAEEEAALLVAAADSPEQLESLVEQRIGGLPLEHVLGWAEFFGRRVAVDPGVFVPRRRTELLVHQALACAGPGAVILDVCCGSGAVGAALAAELDGAQVYATDIDPVAVRCARRNLPAVFEGDLYEPLPASLRGRAGVVVANAPYVPTSAIGLLPPEARLYEPSAALDGGADGVDVLRRVIGGAADWLVPGGHLIVQGSERQAAAIAASMTGHGFVPQVVTDDELDATVVIGSIPPRPIR